MPGLIDFSFKVSVIASLGVAWGLISEDFVEGLSSGSPCLTEQALVIAIRGTSKVFLNFIGMKALLNESKLEV